MKCRICDNIDNNQIFSVKEMMFGTREKFNYFECSSCGCLQIEEIPEDISKHYPSQYYSLNPENIKLDGYGLKTLKLLFGKFYLNSFLNINYNFILRKLRFSFLEIIKETKINSDSKILDVGSGTGNKLNVLSQAGFRNLCGIDPFIEKDIIYSNGVKIFKKELSEVKETFDLVMYNHSFEHMDNPFDVLKETYHLLKSNSVLLIRIPVADSFSWNKYGVNWVNLDAPRHFLLHTVQSMKILADKTGFVIENILYDSDDCQFWVSEQYSKDIPMYDARSYHVNKNSMFSKQQIINYKEQAKSLNANGNGDKACFYLRKA